MDAVSYPPFLSPFTYSCANSCKFSFGVAYSSPLRRSLISHRFSNSLFCRSSNSGWRWDSILGDALKIALSPLKSYIKAKTKNVCNDVSDKKADDDWNWEQWMKHFDKIDDHERFFSVLKSQLDLAVLREDYENAAKIKVAIAAVATNDAVGKVMFRLHRAIKEERYQDAAVMRDYAGAGLVGWWAGISSNTDNPSGHIIHITPEYGRYVARSYSPGLLATSDVGVPLFEIFLTNDEKYGYRQQVVYLKPVAAPQISPAFIKSDNHSNPQSLDSTETFSSNAIPGEATDIEDSRTDNSDGVYGMVDSQNILKNTIPDLKITVLGVISPGKVGHDFKFKFVEFHQDEVGTEEEEDSEHDEGCAEEDDKNGGDDVAEIDASQNKNGQEKYIDESSGDNSNIFDEKKLGLRLKVIIGKIMLILLNNLSNDVQRVPAKLIKMGHSSFSFSPNNDEIREDCISNKVKVADMDLNFHRRRISHAALKLSKSMRSQISPIQVIGDVEKLVTLVLNEVETHQPFSGVTIFNRIETPALPDPLNGLYVGIFGNFSSGVIHLKRKFGKWQDDSDTASDIEFYEYVEAFKLTGDQYIPAGQVAFRAKVGKINQIPLKGLILEEFGVIARYSGQGRIAEPGFQNPRWVNGELVILDGKRLKGGPVIGFLYWAFEYQSLVLFNRINLHQ